MLSLSVTAKTLGWEKRHAPNPTSKGSLILSGCCMAPSTRTVLGLSRPSDNSVGFANTICRDGALGTSVDAGPRNRRTQRGQTPALPTIATSGLAKFWTGLLHRGSEIPG